MADIRVEKKSTSIWPWLLSLLFLVLAGLFLFGAFDADKENITSVDRTELEAEEASAIAVRNDNNKGRAVQASILTDDGMITKSVAALSAFVQNPDAEMNLQHDYTRKGIKMLSASLESLANRYDLENANIQQAKDLMMRKVSILDDNPNSTKHADHIKEAFMSATAVLEQIQQNHLPNMEKDVRAVCDEAKEFSASELTLHQENEVKSFFKNAAKTIEMVSSALEQNERVG